MWVSWSPRRTFAVDAENKRGRVIEVVETVCQQSCAAGDQAHHDLANRQPGVQDQRPDEASEQRGTLRHAGIFVFGHETAFSNRVRQVIGAKSAPVTAEV